MVKYVKVNQKSMPKYVPIACSHSQPYDQLTAKGDDRHRLRQEKSNLPHGNLPHSSEPKGKMLSGLKSTRKPTVKCSAFSRINTFIAVSRAKEVNTSTSTCVSGLLHKGVMARRYGKASHQFSNWLTIQRNWNAIACMLKLCYGEILVKDAWKPKNHSSIRRISKILRDWCHHKNIRMTISNFAHRLRSKSLGLSSPSLFTRGKTNYHLFLASTINRALKLDRPSKDVINTELDQAFQRLTGEKPSLNPDIKSDLRTFVHSIINPIKEYHQKRRGKMNIPLPSGNAVIDNPASKGGATIVLTKYNKNSEYKDLLVSEIWKEKMNKWKESMKKCKNAEERKSLPMPNRKEIISSIDPNQLSYIFKNCLHESQNNLNRSFKAHLFPLIDFSGKIRCPTMHTSEIVWAARAINAFLLPIVKKLSFTREMLNDKKVIIFNKAEGEKLIYSADLKKSTDPISIDTARFILNEVATILGKPSWWTQAVDIVLTNFTLTMESSTKKGLTTCGALMGLGPSWTILNILNIYCAYRAGAPEGSFKTCGDDLVGLWSSETCDKYEAAIASVNLESNKEKSFRAPHFGVFCERLVERVNKNKAVAKHCIRIGQACGMRAIDGKKGILIADDLYKINKLQKKHHYPLNKHIFGLAQRTAMATSLANVRVLRNKHIEGDLGSGGRGCSKADGKTVLRYCMSGGVNLTTVSTHFRKLQHEVKEKIRRLNTSTKRTVSGTELMIYLKTQIRNHLIRNKVESVHTSTILPRKTIIQRILSTENKVQKLIREKGSIVKGFLTIAHAKDSYIRYSKRQTNRIVFLLRQRRYNAALALAKQSWNVNLDVKEFETELFTILQGKIGHYKNLDIDLVTTLPRWSSEGINN